jgi:hypothetical protein
MSAPTSPSHAALEAFKQAVADDYAGVSRHRDDCMVFPADVSVSEFLDAVGERHPASTTVIFVREDGAQFIATGRQPRTLRERVLAKVGRYPTDIEILPPTGGPLYRESFSHSKRALVRYEHRAFAGV